MDELMTDQSDWVPPRQNHGLKNRQRDAASQQHNEGDDAAAHDGEVAERPFLDQDFSTVRYNHSSHAQTLWLKFGCFAIEHWFIIVARLRCMVPDKY